MTTRATTFCDACGGAIPDGVHNGALKVTVLDQRGVYKTHVRDACGAKCLPAVMRVDAFPELGLTAAVPVPSTEQRPPSSTGVYR